MDIKVSIIMPSLNVVDYIRECIESAIHQTLQDIEIICVDAGSDDGTRQILEEYAQKDNKISVIDSEVRSYGRQVNMGISAAKGRYVAVLETDDFVLEDMYERLYIQAEKYRLDYIMADFRSFCDDGEIGRVYYSNEIFKYTPEIYARVLSMQDHAQIYNAADVTLWRGIYLREFLISKHICLNETPGAAYQDICFMHRVKMQARRSMYIHEYGYCYRTDRDGSSVNSIKGLQYAKYEYQYLLEHEDIPEGYRGKIYYLMSAALLGESSLVLPRRKYQWNKEDTECYEWFRKVLTRAVDEGLLRESMGTKEWWQQLQILLDSKEEYVARLRMPQDNKEGLKAFVTKASVIIICGAGKRGKAVYELMTSEKFVQRGQKVLYADNDRRLWGTCLNDIEINSVDLCVRNYPSAYFVIASKFNAGDIRKQLLSTDVKENQIYEFDPRISWD